MSTESLKKPDHPCPLFVYARGAQLSVERVKGAVTTNQIRAFSKKVTATFAHLSDMLQAAEENGLTCPEAQLNSSGQLVCPFTAEIEQGVNALMSSSPDTDADGTPTTESPTAYLAQMGIHRP